MRHSRLLSWWTWAYVGLLGDAKPTDTFQLSNGTKRFSLVLSAKEAESRVADHGYSGRSSDS